MQGPLFNLLPLLQAKVDASKVSSDWLEKLSDQVRAGGSVGARAGISPKPC